MPPKPESSLPAVRLASNGMWADLRQSKKRDFALWAGLTLLGLIANRLSVQLPDAVPALLGNAAYATLALRFGWMPAALSALAVTGWLPHPEFALLALLEAGLIAGRRGQSMSSARRWIWIWGPLLPLALWTGWRLGDDVQTMLCSVAVILLNGAASLLAGQHMAAFLRGEAHLRRQGVARQLTSFASIGLVIPLALIVLAAIQFRYHSELQSHRMALADTAQRLGRLVDDFLDMHQRAIDSAAGVSNSTNSSPPLEDLQRVYPGFLTLLRADSSGRIVDAQPESLLQPDLSVLDRPYFQIARDSSRPYLSAVFRGRGFGDDLIVATSAPLLGRHGEFSGIIEGSLSLEVLTQRLNRALEQRSQQLLLLDTENQVVLNTIVNPPAQLFDAAPSALQIARLSSTAASAEPETLWGSTHLMAGHELEQAGWQLRVVQPLAPLIVDQTLWSLGTVLLCLGLMYAIHAVARRLSSRFAAPISQLLDCLRDLQLDSPDPLQQLSLPPIHGNAELNELIRDLRHLLHRIAGLQQQSRDLLHARDLLNSELEQRVEQRTRELREALSRAELLARSKSAFLARMSHELRSPLASVLGFAEFASNPLAKPDEVREALNTIQRNGELVLGVINNILDASRIDTGGIGLIPSEIEPQTLVSSVCDTFRQRAERAGLRLELDVIHPLPQMIALDRLRFSEALGQLIDNAIKFTPAGVVSVRLWGEADSNQLWVSVSDQGPGIADDFWSRLFSPFEQQDDGVARQHSGTGLGLYLCRRLLDQMQAELRAENLADGGCRFSISLPVPQDATWSDPNAPAVAEQINPCAAALSGHALIVDDAEDIRQLVRLWLESAGLTVHEANNGEQALRAQRAQPFDLILMDMHMPVMDGITASRHLRASGFSGALVALTAETDADKIQAICRAGCDHTHSKPFTQASILHLVKKILGTRS